MTDDELEELRRRRMAQLQDQAQQQPDPVQAEAARAEREAAKQNLLRAILEPDARERLTRVRMARPEIAESLENQLIALYQQGRVRQRIDDATLRELLARFTPKTRETTIERR